ncbi:carbamoyltransferase [Undibacterium sp. LX40W]|uniref:Carbamoyltransferase n=1 Tax=Undibacterium nitidum TaxID=2762298 RepID=A0A923HT95_9BURK|nr:MULTISPECIES: carbamoyltransferase [Undibacterium]MBC3880764.1 carbamoyltransferase [Undibacterium nitidum]MBC3890503.1 carbamoyltransferase [Undibacterium sp. LX40W]
MIVVGISAYYHDSAAALIRDGVIVAAAQEERFTRKKHDPAFPKQALEYCLSAAGISIDQVDHVAFYDKPFLKFERLLETYLAFAPRGFSSFRLALPVWLREKLFLKSLLAKELKAFSANIDWESKLLFGEHHQSHAASAFFPSPFDEAAVLTLDGVGEWATSSLAIGRGKKLEVIKEIHFPHSLGLLYSAFTYHLGFKVNSGEYKVMGLAPYGTPRFTDQIFEHLMDVKDDGSFRLDMKYFDYCAGLTMTNDHFSQLFNLPVRKSEDALTQVHMDMAASLQAATETVVLKLAAAIAQETGMKNLCLAGGVALNCVANGKLFKQGTFEKIWVQPAAGDAGGALGAALAAYHGYLDLPRESCTSYDRMQGSYLGPQFEQSEIERRLKAAGAQFEILSDEALIEACASDLDRGHALGWFQGRMEFGPRALGGRSILGDARSASMQSTLNLKVKFRESFRPFAPAVLREDVQNWFDYDADSPYMLMVAEVHSSKRIAVPEAEKALFGIEKLKVARSEIPAVTHVDYSARIQTVTADTNPKYHQLLSQFKAKTGCPVLVNTSFNVRGEPIVNTPEEAFKCFMGTDIERLAIGNCYLRKERQDPALKISYENAFELD